MKNFYIIVFVCIFGCMLFLSCDKASVTPENPTDQLKMVSPAGGETYNLGDTVKVSFWANADLISTGGVYVSVSTNQGSNFHDFASVQITGNGPAKHEVTWVIGKENTYDIQNLYQDISFATGEEPSWSAIIRVQVYSASDHVLSEKFSVTINRPYVLRRPIIDSVGRNEKITIISTARTDSIGTMTYWYYSDSVDNWTDIPTTQSKQSKKKTGQNHVESQIRYFSPSKAYPDFPINNRTKVQIVDYLPHNKPIFSHWITVTK